MSTRTYAHASAKIDHIHGPIEGGAVHRFSGDSP
jgi:hypothetical protein